MLLCEQLRRWTVAFVALWPRGNPQLLISSRGKSLFYAAMIERIGRAVGILLNRSIRVELYRIGLSVPVVSLLRCGGGVLVQLCCEP